MSSTLTIIRQRRHSRKKKDSSASQRTRRFVQALGFIASGIMVVVITGSAILYIGLMRGLPSVQQLPLLLNPQNGTLLQPTRIYDRSGEHVLATLSPDGNPRLYALLDQIPPTLLNAVIAIAQPDFRSSPGFTIRGWQDPASHTTLAQQLVSDLLLWDQSPSVLRAIHERLLAAQVTSSYTRARVLEWYINSTDFGHYAYGAEAAAQLYLGKSVTQLDLSEAALLAAVSQAPTLNPFDSPQDAEKGRIHVLEAMLAQGLISQADAAQAVLEKPLIQASPLKPAGGNADIAPAFVNLVLSQLDRDFGEDRIARGGMDILTSLDFDLQQQSVCITQSFLEGLTGSDIPEVEGCSGAQYLPEVNGQSLAGATASILVLDSQTGQVLAAVGDMQDSLQGDILASHPAGTSITPFIYLTGFSRGLSPATLGWDIPTGAPNLGQTYHGPVSLRTALVNDYLPPTLSVLDQMGSNSVQTIASSMGVQLPERGKLLQQDFDISPLTLASAYGIFANAGTLAGVKDEEGRLQPVVILKVTSVDGAVLQDWSTSRQVSLVSPQLAYLVNHVLSDDAARWPTLGQSNPLEIGRPAASKLSHSLDLASAYTLGYTPQRVAVTWLGGQTPNSAIPLLSASLWHAIMENSVSGLSETSWEKPDGIVTVAVCDPSGMLPTSACPNTVPEVFIEGRQPVQQDTLYQVFQVNIETGLLATVFTPPDLVEQKIFMVVPAQARAWAKSAGIPSPPTAYDTVQEPRPLEDARISSPGMFTYQEGVLDIRGTAAGQDFVSYRLEYGQGLYPLQWTQIGSDSSTPVDENVLGEWDTSDLNGLYALRLMVVRTDQHLDQAVVQVTIDNTPPQVVITYPVEGQVVTLATEPQVALQAQVNESFLDKVEFFIDNKSVGISREIPLGVLWPAQSGNHTLRVIATDLAGNTAETALHFTVR